LESYDVPGKGDSVPAITSDGLTVWLDITIYYRIPNGNGPWIIQNRTFRDQQDFEDSYIRPKSRSGLREIIAQLKSEDMYAYKRAEVADKLYELLSKRFPDDGAECVSVEVRNIDLPPALKSAIESKLTWQQEAEKMVYVKQKEQMEAERKVIEAGGIAEYQRIVSSTLSPEYLQFKWMDKLSNLNAQTIYYVPTNPATGIPMMKTF
jgi:prohibitin 1